MSTRTNSSAHTAPQKPVRLFLDEYSVLVGHDVCRVAAVLVKDHKKCFRVRFTLPLDKACFGEGRQKIRGASWMGPFLIKKQNIDEEYGGVHKYVST
jgi:hypothetical protein